MSLMPAPRPESTANLVPEEPCIESFQKGARGCHPLKTADPIMAAMGAYFQRQEELRRLELEDLKAELAERLKG